MIDVAISPRAFTSFIEDAAYKGRRCIVEEAAHQGGRYIGRCKDQLSCVLNPTAAADVPVGCCQLGDCGPIATNVLPDMTDQLANSGSSMVISGRNPASVFENKISIGETTGMGPGWNLRFVHHC